MRDKLQSRKKILYHFFDGKGLLYSEITFIISAKWGLYEFQMQEQIKTELLKEGKLCNEKRPFQRCSADGQGVFSAYKEWKFYLQTENLYF